MGALSYLHAHGLDAESLACDQIAVWPEISITPEIENWIIQHKQELITELRQGRTRQAPPHAEQKQQNADALLLEIAAILQAKPDQLHALLSADDIQDIADGDNSRVYMLDYFRLMRADGKLPMHTAPPAMDARDDKQEQTP